MWLISIVNCLGNTTVDNCITFPNSGHFHQPPDPLTLTSKHFCRCSRVSPMSQFSVMSFALVSSLKNGSTHTLPILLNRLSRIQVKRGPVSSIAGSELTSRRLTLNLRPRAPGLPSLWVTKKSTPNISNAFGRGCQRRLSLRSTVAWCYKERTWKCTLISRAAWKVSPRISAIWNLRSSRSSSVNVASSSDVPA